MKFIKMLISRTALACTLVLSACGGDDSVIRGSSTKTYEQIDHESGHAHLLMRGPHHTALKLPQRLGGEGLTDGDESHLRQDPIDVVKDHAYWKAIYGTTFYGLRALWISGVLSDMLQGAFDEPPQRASASSPPPSDGVSKWEACPYGGSMHLTRREAAGPERAVTIHAAYVQCRVSDFTLGTEVELTGEASISVKEKATLQSAVATMGGNGGALCVSDIHTSMAIRGGVSIRQTNSLNSVPPIRFLNTQPGFIVAQTSSDGNKSTIGLQDVSVTRRALGSDGTEQLWLKGALTLQRDASVAVGLMPEKLDIHVDTLLNPLLISARGIDAGSLIAITKQDNKATLADLTGSSDLVIHADTSINTSLRELLHLFHN
ncbi:hypothetical protein [Mycetohabitans endofungorum]|uniref:hypothetical protein n=1 Tax=Mycetohabitans endofungorum TaxID=417203 RepID=UPI002B0524F9|nr:hypothetical protein [Mycetohabitans endofungorum]